MATLTAIEYAWRVVGAADDAWNIESGDTFPVTPGDTPIEFKTKGWSNSAIKTIAFTPRDLSPTVWYDLEDADTTQLYTPVSFDNYSYAEKLVNKANPGTYDADKGASTYRLILNSNKLNGHTSLANRGNGYAQTYYQPKEGAVTVAFAIRLPDTIGSARCPFGVNDNSNHRLFLELNANGTLRLGIGNSFYDTTTTYTAGQVLYGVIIGTGSSVSLWINGVQVITNQTYEFTGTSSVSMLLHARTTGSSPTANWNTAYLGEFVLLERAITDTERAQLQTYLAARSTDNVKIKIILVAGQSNSTGINSGVDYIDAAKEKPNYKIWQVADVEAGNEGDIIPAWEPLKNKSISGGSVGIGYAAAKAYIATQSDPNVRVLIVPAGKGDTGYSDGQWVRTTGVLYQNLVEKANLALTAGADTELLWMMWQQGEKETGTGMTQAQYATYFDDMMDGLRSEITGATNLKVTIGDLVPDFWGYGGFISLAAMDAPNRDANAAYVSSAGLTDAGDNLHFDAASARILGQRHFTAYSAIANSGALSNKTMFASTQNRISSIKVASQTNFVFRTPHKLAHTCGDLRVMLPTFLLNVATGGEAELSNSYVITEMALQRVTGGATVPIYFNGSRTKTVDVGANDIICDPILPSAFGLSEFAADEEFFIKGKGTVGTASETIPISVKYFIDVVGAQTAWYDPATVTISNTDVFGAYTKVSGAGSLLTPVSQCFDPILLGRASTSNPVYVTLGDSISEWVDDRTANGYHGRGMIQRAMGQGGWASMNFAVSGYTSLSFTNAVKFKRLLGYANQRAIVNLGTNDYGTTASSSVTPSLQTRTQTLWNTLKAYNITSISQVGLNTLTTSTDNWATLANQTVRAGWVAGAQPTVFNEWVQTKVADGTITRFISTAPIRDSVETDKHKVTGVAYGITQDDRHPSTGGAVIMGNVIAGVLS